MVRLVFLARFFTGSRGIVFGSTLLIAACNGNSQSSTTPLMASPVPLASPVPSSNLVNWRADATVLSATNPGRACGWGTSAGETRSGVDWRITITGAAISLDEDMRNWPSDHIPFAGALSGRQFTAAYASGNDYLKYVCQFKGATITGTFSDDFSTFDGLETLVWGPPGGETTVSRRWSGSRL
jgi:hypothetical protein